MIVSVLIIAFVLVVTLPYLATRMRRRDIDYSDYSPRVSHWFQERKKNLEVRTQANRESYRARREGRS